MGRTCLSESTSYLHLLDVLDYTGYSSEEIKELSFHLCRKIVLLVVCVAYPSLEGSTVNSSTNFLRLPMKPTLV